MKTYGFHRSFLKKHDRNIKSKIDGYEFFNYRQALWLFTSVSSKFRKTSSILAVIKLKERIHQTEIQANVHVCTRWYIKVYTGNDFSIISGLLLSSVFEKDHFRCNILFDHPVRGPPNMTVLLEFQPSIVKSPRECCYKSSPREN